MIGHAIYVLTTKFQVFANNWLLSTDNFTMDSNYIVDCNFEVL